MAWLSVHIVQTDQRVYQTTRTSFPWPQLFEYFHPGAQLMFKLNFRNLTRPQFGQWYHQIHDEYLQRFLGVSSTVSCNKPPAIEAKSNLRSAKIPATDRGCAI